MKKVLFIFAAMIAFFAVDANAQVFVGAGYNTLNNVTKIDKNSDSESMGGFYAELGYNFNMYSDNWGELGLEPAVRYTFAREAESDEILGVKTNASLTEHYLDIPVNIKYGYNVISSKFKAYAFAGPIFSFGLESVAKGEVGDITTTTHNYTGTVVVSSPDGKETAKGEGTDYNMFDIKVGVGAGVRVFDVLDVKVGYNFGMMNRHANSKAVTNTNVFYVGAALSF